MARARAAIAAIAGRPAALLSILDGERAGLDTGALTRATLGGRARDDPRYAALWRRDSRLTEAIERRRRAASSAQMATVAPDGRIIPAKPPDDARTIG